MLKILIETKVIKYIYHMYLLKDALRRAITQAHRTDSGSAQLNTVLIVDVNLKMFRNELFIVCQHRTLVYGRYNYFIYKMSTSRRRVGIFLNVIGETQR